jgi:MYXO-CTERM domain-containing protein
VPDAGIGVDAGSSRPVGPTPDASAPPIWPRDAGSASTPEAGSALDAGTTTTFDAAVVTQPPAGDAAAMAPATPIDPGAQADDTLDEESGCSVRHATTASANAAQAWLLLVLGALFARRRRRTPTGR